ncbi:MAG TPA: glycosyltransferase [Solirubrobacteraceae bacterium]|jgi:glycosyltransferase involved in cell wall biosynthesis
MSSPPSTSVVIPVLDGRRYLRELLDALAGERPDEVLVIDSGSSDGSPEIARAAGVELLRVEPSSFGHGRTRNLGAEHTRGELICFLTQDATPLPGWLAALREAFALDERIGAVYGPHRPRQDTSPMIARELTEFFAGFSPAGGPVVQEPGDSSFLSNVNACYRRACWEQVRFRDLAYAEDQAFGADMLAAGWKKAYQPEAAVLHAHDYGTVDFMRRYFDEYRGLRASIGHVEPFDPRAVLGDVRALVGADVRWMQKAGYPPAARLRWSARSLAHHSGRKASSALGSRSAALPRVVRKSMSFERSDYAPTETETETAPVQPGRVAGIPLPAQIPAHEYDKISRVLREGPAPLSEPLPGMAERTPLHVAFVIPPFGAGSGGHNIIFQLTHRLERAGHTCSIWVEDVFGHRRHEWPGVIRAAVREQFAPVAAPVHKGFEHWYGADVVVATGWETVYAALELPTVRARAYLVNDHEPEFFPTSVESVWAADTYRQGLYGVCGSPWLRDLYVERYGGTAEVFDYGVDHDVYFPHAVERERDTVVYYCRSTTPRRAVALGLMALHELHRRRPQTRIVMFGEQYEMRTPFPYEHLGVASPQTLARLFSQASVGLCLSMTNYSLIPQEMLACGLPCVDLEGASAESVFGSDGPVELSEFDSHALAGHVERLLESPELWQRRSQTGVEFVKERSWDRAAEQVESALRRALRQREAALLTASDYP